MLTTYGAMIKMDIIEAFDTAVAKVENQNTSGGINWNFVDADLSIDLGVFYNQDYINDCLGVLVDNFYARAA